MHHGDIIQRYYDETGEARHATTSRGLTLHRREDGSWICQDTREVGRIEDGRWLPTLTASSPIGEYVIDAARAAGACEDDLAAMQEARTWGRLINSSPLIVAWLADRKRGIIDTRSLAAAIPDVDLVAGLIAGI